MYSGGLRMCNKPTGELFMLQSLMFFRLMPVTLAGAFLVQAMIHGRLRVYGAENKVFSILM